MRGVLLEKWFDGLRLHYEGEVFEDASVVPEHLIRILDADEPELGPESAQFPEMTGNGAFAPSKPVPTAAVKRPAKKQNPAS